jgi:hypothetical protein
MLILWIWKGFVTIAALAHFFISDTPLSFKWYARFIVGTLMLATGIASFKILAVFQPEYKNLSYVLMVFAIWGAYLNFDMCRLLLWGNKKGDNNSA